MAEKTIHTTEHEHSKNAPKSGMSLPVMAAAVIVVILVVGAIGWFAISGNAYKPVHPPYTSTSIPQINTNTNSNNGAFESSAKALISKLSAYPQQQQFTANYSGSIYTALSTTPTPLSGNLTSQYERYNNSALSVTSVFYNGTNTFKTAVYYSGNGSSYACISNATTSRYTCQTVRTEFNSSTFALSVLLGALSNSSSRSLAYSNSSYNGISCIAISMNSISSTNQSGVIINSTERLNGCIQPSYRIPLYLNISSYSIASGSYQNGSRRSSVPSVSESLSVNLHMTSLINSSSKSVVESLPANATMLG
ncbi:MAG: hypothetical protein KGH94_01260 [Candidatus Micrarchaeota archaeon]|nr:hypothetical protein [Candidatus Micrarchaeota archaeon]